MYILKNRSITSGIIILSMKIASSKIQSHYIAYSVENGNFTIFNYVHPPLFNITKINQLNIGINMQLQWLVDNYEKDFDIEIKASTFYVLAQQVCDYIYSFYKENKKVSQSDIMDMCQPR